jgi:tetratricopeptide (TPR) repeat protein
MADDNRAASAPSLTFGPYRTLHVLGEGGMGVVYEAVHVDTGEVVAIKTVKALDPRHLASIRREIRSLLRVEHPGIVPVVADGVTDDGVPWIAMPFLQGLTLHDHIGTLWTQPAALGTTIDAETTSPMADSAGAPPRVTVRSPRSLGQTLTLIRRLCAPLAYLHGKGLVHRDLKPANVMLQGDRPVLIDLGIAGHFGGAAGREELDLAPIAGTPAYMAPEQILGHLVDARADLYALGCILYECVTGQPPFNSENVDAVYTKHVSEQPLPPSHRVQGVPEALDKLILRLLEKEPAKRMGYAVDVSAALAAMGAEGAPDEGQAPRPYLYRPPFQGRKDILTMFTCTLERLARDRRGGLVLVRGESGAGKTRLMLEVAREAIKSLTVLTGLCRAPAAGGDAAPVAPTPPLYPLLPLLRAAADRVRNSLTDTEQVFGQNGAILASYEPALLDLPGQAEREPPPSLPAKQAQARVIEAMIAVLMALGERAPLLIVLDDLQWADELTLAVIKAFAKAEPAACGVLFVGTFRSEAARPEIEDLARTPEVDTIPLSRLDAWSVAEIVAGMLATSSPPRAVLDALAAHANGNPFFVAQYLHAALERGILRRDSAGRFCFDALGAAEAITTLPLPHTVEELIKQRLDGLDAAGQALTAWAAVLGQELDEDLLRAGAQGSARAAEVLDALQVRGILEMTWEGQWRFSHDKLREIAYRRIDPAERAALHRRAGEALKARFPKPRDKAAALGHHFDRAGLYAKAARYFAQAAAHARKNYPSNYAVPFYEAAIEALGRAPEAKGRRAKVARLYEGKGDVLELDGRHADAFSAYSAALHEDATTSPVDRARRLRKSGETWKALKQFSQALALYDQAEAALGAGQRAKAWWNEWMRIQLERLLVYYGQGDAQRFGAVQGAIRPHVEAWGTAKVRARYFDRCAMYNLVCERYRVSPGTVRYIHKSVAAARKGRDVHDLLAAQCDHGMVLWLSGKIEEAEIQMIEVLDGARRTGYQEIETRSAAYLAVIVRRQRQIDLTERRAQESRHLAKQEPRRDYIGVALANLAWVALRRRDTAEAERLGWEAIAQWRLVPQLAYPFEWVARLPLSAALLSRGDLDGAVAQARAVLAPSQQRLPERIEVALAKAINAFAAGQKTQAESDLREALRKARKHGYA